MNVLCLNSGLFYILGISYLSICFLTFIVILLFSVDLQKKAFVEFTCLIWALSLEIKSLLNFTYLISEFVKQSIYCLGTDLVVVYYQISCLILLFDGFRMWYWFTIITIISLPWVSLKRHPNNFMITHNLYVCMPLLMLFLQSTLYMYFGVCIAVDVLLKQTL